MPVEASDLWVFRIIPIENLESDLRHGLFAKNSAPSNPKRMVIGNTEIIGERDNRIVKCFSDTVVNDYVPFYFSVRTPMLFNIKTGRGVPQRDQKDIVYICCKLTDLTTSKFQWCFTDGNAAKKITKFYNDLKHLDKVDWKSIGSTDFASNNVDGDEDRIRKKHAEFLVKDKVPVKRLSGLAVINRTVKSDVEVIVQKCNLAIEVKVKPQFYF